MIETTDFISLKHSNIVQNGKFCWSAPSNIALVKYWGKKTGQIPANPSLSLTLKNCKTITSLTFTQKKEKDNFSFDFFLDGDKKDSFRPKILEFFERIELYLPFLKDYHFVIESHNTFPHSSGIASSASGIAALALNLMSLEKLLNPKTTQEYFFKKASFLARLGSGSAARSINGSIVVWGKNSSIENSSDLIGTPFSAEKTHENFLEYQDTILLVDVGEKTVSSSLGHDLMTNHLFAEKRFEQSNDNLKKIIDVLQTGNLEEFIKIVESEALTLHAMMMTSMPFYILMKPNTLEIIQEIWKFRTKTNTPVCFTLDAGANVHVLYPKKEKNIVLNFIKEKLLVYCQNHQYICDEIGTGASEN